MFEPSLKRPHTGLQNSLMCTQIVLLYCELCCPSLIMLCLTSLSTTILVEVNTIKYKHLQGIKEPIKQIETFFSLIMDNMLDAGVVAFLFNLN